MIYWSLQVRMILFAFTTLRMRREYKIFAAENATVLAITCPYNVFDSCVSATLIEWGVFDSSFEIVAAFIDWKCNARKEIGRHKDNVTHNIC